MDRRTFLTGLVATGALLSTPRRARASRTLKVLMLGGTNYVGPSLIRAALSRGHEVTIFNRGLTNPHLFPELEKLRGDRSLGREGLSSLGTRRTWDLVLDTWSAGPKAVGESAALLRDRTAVYAYVSTISVYGSFKKLGLSESDPVVSVPADLAREDFGYVLNKRIAEHQIERDLGSRALIVRGSMILGRDEARNPKNQTIYWPIRARAGGEFVAPADESAKVQYTDVGDLAEFTIARAESGQGGAFNAVTRPLRLREFIETCATLQRGRATPLWIDGEFLAAHGGRPFDVVPMWIPENDPEPGFFQFSNDAAVAAGLRCRPLEQTLGGILETYADKPPEWQPDWKSVGGMPSDVEASILRAWREHARATATG